MLNKYLGMREFCSIVIGAALVAGMALADPPGPGRRGPAPFGDWRLDCRDAPCTAFVPLLGSDGSEVLRLSLPRGGAALVVSTPLPIYLPDGLMLGVGARPVRSVPWRTCGPDGCEAWVPLDGDLVDSLRDERGASVTLTLADGTPVRLAVSLRGSAAALRARDRVLRTPKSG